MHYKSFADLSHDVACAAPRVPRDVELIVGIPRSGMLVASMLGLTLNLRVCELSAFLADAELHNGSTRPISGRFLRTAQEARSVLVIDDSVCTGRALGQAREQLRSSGYRGTLRYGALYATPSYSSRADAGLDFVGELVELPRAFQWNVLHRREVARFCFDIDGVLCADPSVTDNDDGENYLTFLRSTRPLVLPSQPVGYLVTSRLEKYRPQTEQWLADHGVQYRELHMLDVPSAAERRRLNLHASFKASVYARLPAELFIESESRQAVEICRRSGKPVLDYATHRMLRPGLSLPHAKALGKKSLRSVFRSLQSSLTRSRP